MPLRWALALGSLDGLPEEELDGWELVEGELELDGMPVGWELTQGSFDGLPEG
jgi:hypothetical protein